MVASYNTSFASVNFVSPGCATCDKVMIDQLRTIGIEKGKPFNPDARTTEILNAAAGAAHDYIEVMYDAGFPPLNDEAYWAVPAMPELI